MAAYFMASYRVTDPKGYEPYVPAVIPTLIAHNCEVLAADYASQPIEGEPNAVTVILKFASKEAAMAWYKTAEYQAVKHHRIDNSEGAAVVVDQWTPPS